MPRKIEKHACRIPLGDAAIYKYPYMTKWKLDATVSGRRLRPTLAKDQRESLRMAQEMLDRARRAAPTNGAAEPTAVTIRDVADRYLESRRASLPEAMRASPRKEISYRNDEDRLNMIAERLPVALVFDLRKAHCMEFVKQRMREKSGNNPKKKVGRVTAGKPVKVLLAALNHAVTEDVLPHHPLEGLRLPKPKPEEIRKKRRAMTPAEYGRFKQAAVELDVEFQALNSGIRRVPQALLYLAIFESGRRLGEMLDLEWCDVRLHGESASWDFWDTKGQKLSPTASGEPENYPIPPTVVEYLRALKAMHERHLGRPVGKGDRVFVGPCHGGLSPRNALRHFYRILRRAGIQRADARGRTVDQHSARMFAYSRGSAAGIELADMMSWVGHRDIRTAMRYRDERAVQKKMIAEKLAGLDMPKK